MKNTHYDTITKLLKHVQPKLFITHTIEFKNVFGAVGGYVNGRIFVSCGKFGVALRLPVERLDILFKKQDIKPLRYFPKGHIKKEYAILPERMLENNRQFRTLVDESVQYVLSRVASY